MSPSLSANTSLTYRKRLEGQLNDLFDSRAHKIAVTSRLEDVASSQTSPAQTSLRSPTSNTHDAVASHVSSAPAPVQQSGGGSDTAMSPAVQAYQDEIVNGALAGCIAKSKEIGGIVEQHVSSASQGGTM